MRFTDSHLLVDRLHNGNPGLRSAMWSQNDPVTLFGAAVTKSGWAEIRPTFDWRRRIFRTVSRSNTKWLRPGSAVTCVHRRHRAHDGVRGRRTGGPYSLRVTTILRREDGEWKGRPPPWRPGSGQRLRARPARPPKGRGTRRPPDPTALRLGARERTEAA